MAISLMRVSISIPTRYVRQLLPIYFARYAYGEGSKSILASLREQGLKTNKGVAPTYSFVANLLKNRRYLVELRFKDTVVEDAFPPLVSIEVFDKCQKRLAGNQRRPGSFKTVEDKYMLTGRIFCGHCGGTMNGVSGTSSKGATHRYYHCHAARKLHTCDKKATSKETLLKLEHDKDELEIDIAKSRMERPVLSKDQIKFYLTKNNPIAITDIEQKQWLIETYLLSVYVYDDKMLICLKHSDGDICVTYDEIQSVMDEVSKREPHSTRSIHIK